MRLFLDGQELELSASDGEATSLGDHVVVRTPEGVFTGLAVRQGDDVLVSYRGRVFKLGRTRPRDISSGPSGSGELRSPMPGLIVAVNTEVGAIVAKGDRLLVLEAMKTQQPILAPFAGKVIKLAAEAGAQVQDGALLVALEPEASGA